MNEDDVAETPIAPSVNAAERQAVAERWNAHHAMRYLGAEVDLDDPAVIRLTVDPVQPHHRGGLGTEAVNGVVMAGVFDLTIGQRWTPSFGQVFVTAKVNPGS